jgi:maltose alpha-D-glucosyltransferase/alpha-amylase
VKVDFMLPDDPLWYKDAIIYELHVRAFHDSVGDGYGDFRGLAQKLDYLQDLGVTVIWLLPFYPSPLRDDGYDIAEYTSINPAYGTLADFQDLLAAAHERGIRVLTELVLNHTSDQHAWFQRARLAPPGSPERDFYVWSDTPDKYRDVRIIFKDFEPSNWSWDPVAKAYYWHRFYAHQPDLNFDNPAVWEAIFPVVDFWLSMGVDGMRLDAVPYLYEREGTSCENLQETHAFLKALRRHIDLKFPNRMLLSEANQWPEDAVAYFGAGDETHMAFHFPLMPRMFMSIHMEDRFPIIDILDQTPTIPDNCQWCQFLRNHDELTLEMVTDEERDYMYRAYAGEQRARINLGIRRRLAPLLGNNRRRIELMNGLLFSLPGTPVIYYGDEIGMGDNIYLGDRNGVRTPMQWSSDRNAGFSRANPQKLFLPITIDPEYHYEAVNVEAQQNNPNSLLWWMKRLIALRKRFRAFGRGTLEFLHPKNRKILAFVRKYKDEQILVVANLSRFVQHVELDLSAARGCVPVELFGRALFPPVGQSLYPLSLGPHAFYWFELEPPQPQEAAAAAAPAEPAVVPVPVTKLGFMHSQARELVEPVLQAYLQATPWAGGPGDEIKTLRFVDLARLTSSATPLFVALIEADYIDGTSRTYCLPVAVLSDERFVQLREQKPTLSALLRLTGNVEGLVIDALHAPECAEQIVRMIAGPATMTARGAELMGTLFGPIDWPAPGDGAAPHVSAMTEDSTSAVVSLAQRLVLKVLRQVEPGIHPQVEMGRYLTHRAGFEHVAALAGTLEYRRRGAEPTTLAILHRYVPNEGTAWQYTLDELSRFFERVLALPAEQRQPPLPPYSPAALAQGEMPPLVHELIGRYVDSAKLLGQRTAELHRALGAETRDPAFAPENVTPLYQRALYQSMRNVQQRTLHELAMQLSHLPAEIQNEARQALDCSDQMLHRFRSLVSRRPAGKRIRCHGNLGLGELLFTGKDFVILDFEGEPERPLGERRVKRSPLGDVATMVRSFHHAALGALLTEGHRRGRTPGMIRPEDVGLLEQWAELWYVWNATAFVRAYQEHVAGTTFLPAAGDEFEALLADFLLERALRELAQELDHRPAWAVISLRAILQLVGRPAEPLVQPPVVTSDY